MGAVAAVTPGALRESGPGMVRGNAQGRGFAAGVAGGAFAARVAAADRIDAAIASTVGGRQVARSRFRRSINFAVSEKMLSLFRKSCF